MYADPLFRSSTVSVFRSLEAEKEKSEFDLYLWSRVIYNPVHSLLYFNFSSAHLISLCRLLARFAWSRPRAISARCGESCLLKFTLRPSAQSLIILFSFLLSPSLLSRLFSPLGVMRSRFSSIIPLQSSLIIPERTSDNNAWWARLFAADISCQVQNSSLFSQDIIN